MTDKLSLKLNGKIVEVTMDDNGRYSLNDLFRASGSIEKKKPYRFLNDSKRNLKVVKTWENKGRDESDKDSNVHLSDFDSYVIQMKINRATKTFGSFKTAVKYLNFLGFHLNAEGVFEKEDKPEDKSGHLYVIKNSQGLIKIGISRNPDKRLQSIQTACGYKCNLLYTKYVPEGVYNLEQNLHLYYKDFRTFGEWFDIEDRYNLIDTVNEIADTYLQKSYIQL